MSVMRKIRATYWVARFVFRFLSGRPLTTSRTTDATFLRPASRMLSGEQLNRWTAMRGAARSAWRLGAMYGVFLLLLLPISWTAEKVHSLPWYLRSGVLLWSHLSLLLLAGGVHLLRRITREYGYFLPRIEEKEEGGRTLSLEKIPGQKVWRREKVLPIARSVSVILGHHIPDRRADRWVMIPTNYREGGSTEILLPPHFTGADEGMKKRLISSVSAKLGVPSLNASWQTEGSAPRVLLTAPPTPPSRVEYSDVEHLLLSSEEYRPLLGVEGGGDSLVAEMIDDSPHIGLSAGPGAGKSTLAKLIMMQALRWGWGIVVLDWKQTEAYSWLGGLPGVTYLTQIEKIHEMGVRLAEEVDLRKIEGMAGRAKVLVVRDEWNVTAELLMAYYQDLRATADPEEKKLMPLRSPALRGFAVLDYAGREYGLFDLCIAQRFSARAFNGNADIRECFQIKCLARYSAQTQKMLAPDIKPFPRKSNTPGRWTIVTGDKASVVQVPFITNDEARKYASGGLANPLFPLGTTQRPEGSEADSTLGDLLRPDATSSGTVHNPVDSSTRGRKLSDLVDGMAHLGITSNILRNASRDDEKGDPDFPRPVGTAGRGANSGYTYNPTEVLEWARRRHARMASEKVTK